MPKNFGRRLDTIQAGQSNIHQYDSGAHPASHLHRIRTRFRLSDHRKLFAVFEDGLYAIAHDLVIVNQQNVESHNLAALPEFVRVSEL